MSPTPTTTASPSTLRRAKSGLLAAANIIEQRGRVQGRLQDDRGRVCALGALNLGFGAKTGNDDPRATVAHKVARLALASDINDSEASLWPNSVIFGWSDHPKMSAKRVARRLRKVAGNL